MNDQVNRMQQRPQNANTVQNRQKTRHNQQNRSPNYHTPNYQPRESPQKQPSRDIPPQEMQKIIALDEIQTKTFIANVISDILHDSTKRHQSAIDVTTIASAYVCWLLNVNSRVLSGPMALSEYMLSCYFARNDSTLSIEENNKRKLEMLPQPAIDLPNDMIIDQCSKGVAHCDSRAAHALSTYSTFFDTGSQNQTCGKVEKGSRFVDPVKLISARVLGTELINYYPTIRENSDPIYGSIVPVCKFATHMQSDPTSFYIVGVISIHGESLQVVLAYRGVILLPTKGKPTIVYPFRFGSAANNVVTYGWSTSAADVTAMVTEWKKVVESHFRYRNKMAGRNVAYDIDDYNSINDVVSKLTQQLYSNPADMIGASKVFVHLSAKLWGDLGLVCEAVSEATRYVVTHDKMLAVFSATLGANYYWNGSARLPVIRPHVTLESITETSPFELVNSPGYIADKKTLLAKFFHRD